MPFFIVKQDIKTLKVDAIVNSANPIPTNHGGLEAEVYQAAGPDLFNKRKQLGHIPFGEARISLGYQLPSDYVIHTVAPIASITEHFETVLKQSYTSALTIATNNNLSSIAFPLLASGANGCKRDVAIEIAIDAINDYLSHFELDVYLVLYEPYHPVRLKQMHQNLIRYLSKQTQMKQLRSASMDKLYDSLESHTINKSIAIDAEFQTFQEKLFELIDQMELKETDVYKRANISRKLFSKIRSDRFYIPSKNTVIALVFALRLEPDDALEFLQSAGYYLAEGIEFDRIIRFFLEKQIYDILDINITLHEYGHPPLGSK